MKDVINSPKKIANDMHLKNIFINDSYLELGIIDVDVCKRILNFELVNINEVTYFPVQNKGLGHSNLNDPSLKNYLPYYFFHQLANNNSSLQLCITYGLLKYTSIDSRETFMPIILIPITLYFENNEILVQMVSLPIENPMIYSIFNTSKISFLQTLTFKDIYTLDYALTIIDKLSNGSVRLDNYLTYAQIKEHDIILSYKANSNSSRFSFINDRTLHNRFHRDKKNDLSNKKDKYIYSYIVLNKTQNEVLKRLIDGESLCITGYNGTGKTTVIKSFICNNLFNNKKTLYISNSNESIQNIDKFLKESMLSNYYCDLTESFNKILIKPLIESYYDPTDDINPLIDNLNEYYKYLNDYENKINQKLNDFRFIEMIVKNYLVDIEDANKLTKNYVFADDMSNIYKHEYEQIYNVLLSIEQSFQKIKSFQNSIWKEIPIINNITHVNQVINVVFQLNIGLKKLREYEIVLGNYGVKSILSFSEMKKCIGPMDKLCTDQIPTEWKESLSLYENAKETYAELKKDIYEYQEKEYFLSTKYRNLDTINIEEQISFLYDKYYHKKDLNVILSLLQNKKEVTRIIRLGEIDLKDFYSVKNELEQILGWKFIEKDEYFFEVLNIARLFEKNIFSSRMIVMILNNKVETECNELTVINKNIMALSDELKILEKQYPKFKLKDLDFSKGNINYENEVFRTYDTKQKKLKKLIKEYQDKTGYNYSNHEAIIEAINLLKDYYDTIKQKKYRKIIVDYFQKLDENLYIESLSLFRILFKSYMNIRENLDYLNQYSICFDNQPIKDIISDFEDYINYLKRLYESNSKMLDIVIENDLPYIKPKEYFVIQKALAEFQKKIDYLHANTNYKNLFGFLYQEEHTNVLNIMKVIQMYDSYINSFINDENMIYNSFKNYSDLKETVDKVVELVNEIGENLRLYSLIFKDSVSRYYFSNIENNVAYLLKLLEAKDELTIYLNITRGIGVLNDHHLYSMIKFIEENDDIKGIASKFSMNYFEGIIKEYMNRYEGVDKSSEYIEILNKTVILEDVICKQKGIKFINEIIRNIPVDVKKKKIKYYDYPTYFDANKNRLRIFLANKSFVSSFYKYIDYDTVIVDDAHMLTTGDFNSIFKGKQVVICGDYQSNKIVNQNLLSLATTVDTITFKNRYLTGPRQLTNHMPSVFAPHKKSYDNNLGIKVIEKNIGDYIYNLYMDDCNVKINYFIRDINRQREAYENISKTFYQRNISVDDIIYFLTNNIYICDINVRNYIQSDINILYLKDYCFEDSQIVASNLFEILMLAKNELVIYDSEGYLLRNIELDFFKMIKELIVSDKAFIGSQLDVIGKEISKDLTDLGYVVYFPGNNVNMLIKSKESDELKTLVILYSNGNISEIINLYRDIYNQYIKNGHKIIIKSIVDLLQGKEKFIKSLCEEIDG